MALRRSFTVKEKAEIISKLKNGVNNTDLCKEYKVSHSTISMIWKNRDKILECLESKSVKIKRDRKPMHQDIDNALSVWFKAQRSNNVPLSGRLLREKANHFARLFGKINFKCTESWIYRFRQRHDIAVGNDCGVTDSVSQIEYDNWLKAVFPKLIEDYTESQIWNADETGLFFKLTPEKKLKFQGEKCINGKLTEDRITVLVAASMVGEKRKLLVIGKAKPRCFQNIKSMPVDYEDNKNARMTSEIFEKVLRKWDSHLRSNEKKIILFVDTCPVHPKIENLTNIKLAFLPPNTTSVIQPIEQGIIKSFKSHFRKILAQKMMENVEKMTGTFSVNLLDAFKMVTMAWTEVSPDMIKKCFLHAGFCKSSDISTIDDSHNELDIPLPQLRTTSSTETNVSDLETYVDNESQLITASSMSDSKFIEIIIPSHTTPHEENEEEEDCKENTIPTTKDVLCAVSMLKRYCLFGDGKDIIDIEQVIKIEHTLQRTLAQENKLKQSFTTSTDLMVHETSHSKQECSGCKEKFDTFVLLTSHRARCKMCFKINVRTLSTLQEKPKENHPMNMDSPKNIVRENVFEKTPEFCEQQNMFHNSESTISANEIKTEVIDTETEYSRDCVKPMETIDLKVFEASQSEENSVWSLDSINYRKSEVNNLKNKEGIGNSMDVDIPNMTISESSKSEQNAVLGLASESDIKRELIDLHSENTGLCDNPNQLVTPNVLSGTIESVRGNVLNSVYGFAPM